MTSESSRCWEYACGAVGALVAVVAFISVFLIAALWSTHTHGLLIYVAVIVLVPSVLLSFHCLCRDVNLGPHKTICAAVGAFIAGVICVLTCLSFQAEKEDTGPWIFFGCALASLAVIISCCCFFQGDPEDSDSSDEEVIMQAVAVRVGTVFVPHADGGAAAPYAPYAAPQEGPVASAAPDDIGNPDDQLAQAGAWLQQQGIQAV